MRINSKDVKVGQVIRVVIHRFGQADSLEEIFMRSWAGRVSFSRETVNKDGVQLIQLTDGRATIDLFVNHDGTTDNGSAGESSAFLIKDIVEEGDYITGQWYRDGDGRHWYREDYGWVTHPNSRVHGYQISGPLSRIEVS